MNSGFAYQFCLHIANSYYGVPYSQMGSLHGQSHEYSVHKESYGIYFQQYSYHNHDFIVSFPLAVNFAQDTFYITGEVEPINPPLIAEILPFHKIVLRWPQHGYHDLLCDLPQLQELLEFSDHYTERHLLSGGEYQQVWSNEYTSCTWNWGKRSPCTICFWAAEFRNICEEDLVPVNRTASRWGRDSITPHEFVLTYSSELRILPTPSEIHHSTKPMLRWVRRNTWNLSDPARELFGCDKWSHFHKFALEYFRRPNVGNTGKIVQVLMDMTNSS
jgi:hypothetical protein